MARRHFSIILALVLLAACGKAAEVSTSGPGTRPTPNVLLSRIEERLLAARGSLIEIRRDFHRHPELSGQEVRTAGIVAERLRGLGFEVRTGVGGHGVVGRLVGRNPGYAVAFRADMDAVRSTAPDPVDFPSVSPGIRHICGHDIHTTVALALAEGFAALGGDFPGELQLIFQPAEENVTGARAMLATGFFEERPPAVIFAVHTAPLEVGTIGTKSGVLLGSRGSAGDIAAGVPGTAPGAVNDSTLEARTREVLRAILGEDNVRVLTEVVPGFSEDFGHFQARVPGVMYFLGVSNSARGLNGFPHAPDYAADEESIVLGARVMAAVVLSEMGRAD
jgi:metal-dependent amidase/aminoacylase/carboxypeptidase family protein